MVEHFLRSKKVRGASGKPAILLEKRHEAAEDKKSCEVSTKRFFERVHQNVTMLRSNARNDFELQFFKLFANSTFGKFIGK